jgi:hypothetical protein
MVLLGRDLWSVVEGSELKPSTPGTKQIAWHRKDGQARASILLNAKIQHYNTSLKLKHQKKHGISYKGCMQLRT